MKIGFQNIHNGLHNSIKQIMPQEHDDLSQKVNIFASFTEPSTVT
jgi:hypothetical protein